LGGAVAAVLGAAVERAVATDRTWTNNGGAGGFAWGTAGNWSPAGVPGPADRAILSNTAPGALDLGGVTRTLNTLRFTQSSGTPYSFSNGGFALIRIETTSFTA